jgi:hypothetical protein
LPHLRRGWVSIDSTGVAGDFGELQVLWNPHLRGGVVSVHCKRVGEAGFWKCGFYGSYGKSVRTLERLNVGTLNERGRKNLTQRRRAHRGFAEKTEDEDAGWRFEAQCELTRERIAGNTLLVNYFLGTVRME